MKREIKWGNRRGNEPLSPFEHGKVTRPIRMILHSSSLHGTDEVQLRAIELLREVAKHTRAVEVIDTEPGALPYLHIENDKPDGSTIPITVKVGNKWTRKSGITAAEERFKAFGSVISKSRSDEINYEDAYQDFLVAMATDELSCDVLITLSPFLLVNRDNLWIDVINLRSPLEALKIIGLLLRSRGGYVFEPMPYYFLELDRRAIYRELVHHKLSNMSRYIKACAHAEGLGAIGLTYLAESTVVRCVRALHARDEIGALFYMPQSNESRDAMMYHFDYLALLLVGAFDAQARVARLVYGITDVGERNSSFRFKKFRKAMQQSGALALYNQTSNQFVDLMTLLKEVRNSIHASVWPTIASVHYGKGEESFIKVPSAYQDDIWRAAQQCGSALDWGLIRHSDFSMLLLEPYSYAINLVAKCFAQIDEIGRLTDVARFLPADFDISQLREKSSYDEKFIEFVRQRVELLD